MQGYLKVCALLLTMSLTACGSGGGGGSADAPTLTYSGATSQATITTANAEALALGAYFGDQNNIVGMLSANTPASTPPQFQVRNASRILRRSLRQNLPAPNATPLAVKFAAVQQPTTSYPGACGGLMTSNMLTDSVTGSYSGTMRFDNFCEDGLLFNGTAAVSGTFEPASGSLLTLTISLHPLLLSQDGSSFTIDGQMKANYGTPQYAETDTLDFLLRDDASGRVFRFENYFDGINYGPDYIEETISGRYYHPDYGYLDLSCPQPLRTFTGLLWPAAGTFQASGSGGTFVRMIFTTTTTSRLEADTDGDGSSDWQKDLSHPLPPDYVPTNHPPVASAGADLTAFQGDLVNLDGSASSDPDGELLSFQWSFSSCPGSCPALNNPATATPSFRPQAAGSYTLQLVVSDGAYSSNDSLVVTVSPAQPTQPDLLAQEWIYGRFGTYIGRAGLSVTDLEGDGTLEIVTAASPSGFGSNQYWYVVRDDGAGGYQQVHLSAISPVAITRILATDIDGDGIGEILVGYQDGRIDIFAGDNYALKYSLQTPGAVTALATADLDGDGSSEIITSDNQMIYVFAANGNPLWSTSGYGGSDLAVGNVDDDPALEIVVAATGHGYVIDTGSQQLEWDYINGFGLQVRTGDIDGDGRDEIVGAAGWQKITIFDAELQSPRSDIATALDIGTLLVTDLDGDGIAEILYGDNQWGSVHCYEGDGLTERWAIQNPEHGTTGLAVGDVDGDGTVEVLWGAGGSSTGPDFLFIANATTGIEWQNVHLDGPLSTVAVGDVDDDGQDEIVMVSYSSNSGYADGVISIFDAATHVLEWQSTDLPNIYAWEGVNAVRIADVDDDGSTEFVIATSSLYDGLVQVYNGQTHALESQSATYSSEPFTALAVADVDGDGATEIVVGTAIGTSGASGTHLIVLNGTTLAEEWQSVSLTNSWAATSAIAVADVDNDGHPEILAAAGGDRVYAIDGVTHQYDWLEALPATTIGAFDTDGDGQLEILVGQSDGTIAVYAGDTFTAVATISTFGDASIEALTLSDLDGDGSPEWLIAGGGDLSVLENGSGRLLWRASNLGAKLGHYNHLPVKDIDGDGKQEILVGSDFALYQFD